jgi:hypothetical protein
VVDCEDGTDGPTDPVGDLRSALDDSAATGCAVEHLPDMSMIAVGVKTAPKLSQSLVSMHRK